MNTKPKSRGIRIRHRTKRSGIALLAIYHKPLFGDSIYPCPNCQVIHTDSYGKPVKTVHLWLDDTGGAVVSQGVYVDLKRAGHFDPIGVMPPILTTIADVVDPPPITLRGNRFEVDRKNSRILEWRKEPVT